MFIWADSMAMHRPMSTFKFADSVLMPRCKSRKGRLPKAWSSPPRVCDGNADPTYVYPMNPRGRTARSNHTIFWALQHSSGPEKCDSGLRPPTTAPQR